MALGKMLWRRSFRRVLIAAAAATAVIAKGGALTFVGAAHEFSPRSTARLKCRQSQRDWTLTRGVEKLGSETPFLDLDDLVVGEPLSEYHAEKLSSIVESLSEGGMGVLPTDTQHAYVTAVSSREGTRRIYNVKGIAESERKPLSLLCSDLSMASHYCDMMSLPRHWYQIIKKMLPGPYTFIMRASSEMPKVVLEHKTHRKLWKRREVGIRVPMCGLVQHITSDLGEPLLASSAWDPESLWMSQRRQLDFVVASGQIDMVWGDVEPEDRVSTVIDLTMQEPVLRRQGLGDASPFFGHD